MAAETLEIPLESAKAMNAGYSEAFPKVVVYQDNVTKAMTKKGYAVTKSGRRYYLSETWKFYKVANYLIQGWCADMLKEKMIEIDEYIEEQGLGIRMVLCIHDELQFSVPYGEEHHMVTIRDMMQDMPDVLIPIVAEVERTDEFWSDKKKVIGF